jgi:hypothetical protein
MIDMIDWFLGDENDPKRTLSNKGRQELYKRAQGRCENPACHRKIKIDIMAVGHKKAWSKGGRTIFSNLVCLCLDCNKRQGTDSWAVFLRKQGVEDPKNKLKKKLKSLTLVQLKALAQKHKIKVSGTLVENLFNSYRKAPTKAQYVNKLAKVVTEKELSSLPKETLKPTKRKKRRKSDNFWW